jgi:hypothetical protein
MCTEMLSQDVRRSIVRRRLPTSSPLTESRCLSLFGCHMESERGLYQQSRPTRAPAIPEKFYPIAFRSLDHQLDSDSYISNQNTT